MPDHVEYPFCSRLAMDGRSVRRSTFHRLLHVVCVGRSVGGPQAELSGGSELFMCVLFTQLAW